MIRIHFPEVDAGRYLIPLGFACGVGNEIHPFPLPQRFERLRRVAMKQWHSVPLDDAQVVVYPHQYRPDAQAAQVAETAREANLPCLFFRGNDDSTPADPPYGVVYRTSLFVDRLTPAERAMPDFCDDPLRGCDGQVMRRQKAARPTIGFCGYVGTTFSRTMYHLVGRRQKVAGLTIRQRILRTLSRASNLETRFIPRPHFWNGVVTRYGYDERKKQESRKEYLANLYETDYNLCVRGKGNYSTRFYEVLAGGRIPVFVNTRCVLPFSDRIDYRKHCVWIEEDDIPRAEQIVLDFHASLDDDAFQQLQLDNRRLWEQWLAPESFYQHVLKDALTEQAGDEPRPHAPRGRCSRHEPAS